MKLQTSELRSEHYCSVSVKLAKKSNADSGLPLRLRLSNYRLFRLLWFLILEFLLNSPGFRPPILLEDNWSRALRETKSWHYCRLIRRFSISLTNGTESRQKSKLAQDSFFRRRPFSVKIQVEEDPRTKLRPPANF